MRLRLREQRNRSAALRSPVAVPAVLLAVAIAELVANANIEHRVAAAICTPVMIVALGWRRKAALLVSVGVGAAFAVQTIVGVPVNAQVATLLTLGVTAFAIGRHGKGAQAGWGVAGLIVLVVTCSMISSSTPGDTVVAAMVFVAAWLGGVMLARRAQEAAHLTEHAAFVEATAEERAVEAVELERRRIARELHDGIAHAITVMVLQAGAAETVLGAAGDERARDALGVVQTAGRAALVDMKHLLGVLRTTGDGTPLTPMPSLCDLNTLVERIGATGLPVSLSTDGDLTACPPSVAASAYQIVREALTNTLRHAGPARAQVTVHCNALAVDVEVLDDGKGGGGGGPGYGLIGMRERVAAFGGDFDAGVRPEGGFAVHARFPLTNGSGR